MPSAIKPIYKASLYEAHQTLGEVVPPEDIYQFHILVIEHGRKTCQARRPSCQDCVLKKICWATAYDNCRQGGGEDIHAKEIPGLFVRDYSWWAFVTWMGCCSLTGISFLTLDSEGQQGLRFYRLQERPLFLRLTTVLLFFSIRYRASFEQRVKGFEPLQFNIIRPSRVKSGEFC